MLILSVLLVIFFISQLFSISKSKIVSAQSAGELQAKIDQRATDIAVLEEEIVKYQKQINELGSQASSLSATIKSLELTKKKLETDIKITENKVAEKNIEIQQLGLQIGDKQETIIDNRRIIAQAFVTINEYGDRSLPELFLQNTSLSDAWDELDELNLIQKGLTDRIADLEQVKAYLEVNKQSTEKAKSELLTLNTQLKNQRSVVLGTVAEKDSLLKETRQSEAEYQKILANKKALKEEFEREVLSLESQLRIAVDPNSIPRSGSGVLAWPLDNIVVTQYFGNTEFATKNPQIYNGKGHTGVDFRASIGTPVKASLSGIVVGVENTDLIPRCYSYGKWVMIKHPNGLSTLYAHLSLQTVSVGQQVSTGQIIGYSGNTGYTTGPHLHYGVYATQGVDIRKFAKNESVNCVGATIPLADFSAYLNPLSFL